MRIWRRSARRSLSMILWKWMLTVREGSGAFAAGDMTDHQSGQPRSRRLLRTARAGEGSGLRGGFMAASRKLFPRH